MITISNLHYQYGSSRKVLTGLNLELSAGKIYGILGSNGAGKSTILKCICGLLLPQSGSINVGVWQAKDRLPSFLSELFFLPEDPFGPDIKPEEYGRVYGVFYPKYDHILFLSLCSDFEIPSSHRLDEMSHGQKKKALIAFGIACKTKLIILDEPTNGLDIPSKSQFRKIIAKSTHSENCIVISTHQIKDVENLIDHVIIVNEGNVLFDKSVAAISKALFFVERPTSVTSAPKYYEEESIRGYTVIEPNPEELESKIDLEILYKAVLSDPKLLKNPFN